MFAVPGFGYGETVQHRRYQANTKDRDGYRVTQYAAPVPVEGVGVDQPTVVEQREHGITERAQADLVLFLPPGYQADYRDRFIIRGREYEVEGVGEPLKNFLTGSLFRTEVKVRRVSGES